MRKRKDFIQGYRDALARLIRNEGTIITGSYKINFDTVALEANRKRGAIKGNTEEIVALKQDILEAERKRNKQNLNSGMDTREIIRSKNLEYKELMIENEKLKTEIESLSRQLASVIYQLALTKKEISENKDAIEFVKK
ncbi:hypothetical protein [Acinetobacter sp. Ac_5812]|uniref:hypothetical protein n=1 Tax=Acinetobacter sp. Ac_5812 TaxID=1848937 RepID=UPI00148FEF86|nr:hypothetical protein [Acinetobacter sp. Ac_5812]NNP67934.1 hypothetical protein [Acinetobacter sp. Ac_5812]